MAEFSLPSFFIIMENNGSIVLILIILVVLFIVVKFVRKFKSPAIGSLCLINGGVKTGKTTYAVNLAVREYKARYRRYKVQSLFNSKIEEPCLYSNIPLSGVKHVLIVPELLTRDFRFTYGSVILLSEFSLVADSQLIKDKVLNDKLLEFFKLIGHETKGGCVIADTQSISDVHYSLKRVLDRHLYIYKTVKFIPFFLLMYVREERYAEDGTIVNAYNDDIEESLVKVLVPKKVWKMFDTYCYSSLTDDLPIYKEFNQSKVLKVKNIVSFRTSMRNDKLKKN